MANGLVPSIFDISNGKFIQCMPEKFPEDAGSDDETKIEKNVAHELTESDEVVEHVEMGLRCCERLQLGLIRRHY